MKRERRQGALPTGAPAPIDRRAALITAAFVGGTLCYLALFFAACPDRLTKLLLLFAPDFLCTSWVGGSWRRFSVLDRLPILAVTAFILAVGYAAGRLLLAAIRADRELTRLERAVFSTGVGLNAISLYTLAVGLCGGLRQSALFIVPAISVLVGALLHATLQRLKLNRDDAVVPKQAGSLPHVSKQAGSLPHVAEAASFGETKRCHQEGWLARHGLWLAVPFVLIIMLGGMLPPWDFDVREYHLQVPKEWYLKGRIDFLPHNVYGNMPLGAEMHAVLGITLMPGQRNWWWGALVGKTVMAAFAPLTALALYAAGKRMFGATAGVVAALVFLSTPWITHVSINGLNEGVSAYYWLTAFYAVWLWSRSAAPRPGGLLMLAGFLAGGAVSCKYPAALFVVAPLAGWLLLQGVWRGRVADAASFGRLGVKPLLAFLLAATVGCGLWFAKNAALTRNPTYPLLYSVFDGNTRTPEKDQQWRRAHQPPPYTVAELGDKLYRIAGRSELLSPLLLPLAAMALFARKQRRNVLLLWGLGLFVLAVWWLLTHRIDRFWIPALPLAALLAGAGAGWTTAYVWRCVVMALLLCGLIANFLIASTPSVQGEFIGDNRYFVALEELRLDEPQAPQEASRVDPAHRHLNRVVSGGNCVLLVGDAQPFDLEVPVLYNTCFDDCLFEQLLRGGTRAERLAALREHRISHIYISWSEIARYRSPGNYGFTDYVTPKLVRDELVAQQGLLRPVSSGLAPERGEIFEVLSEGQ